MGARPVSRALIVGINRYQNPEDNLRGCVNDALAIAALVTEQYGFVKKDVRLLRDGRATTINVRRGLRWLVDGAGPGSRLLFHYSGHGSQVRDRNGDEPIDRLDEIICPHDLDWNDPITDDELAALASRVTADVMFTIILDCCHSGTGVRASGGNGRTIAAPRRGRYLPPPADVTWRRPVGAGVALSRGRSAEDPQVRRFGTALTTQHVVLIAGCRSDQTSADALIENAYRGALTHSLVRTLRTARYRISNRDLVRRAGEWLTRHGYEQVPQIEGRAGLLARHFLAAPVLRPLERGEGSRSVR